MLGDYYFLRTLPDGRRQISRRVWILVWVVPVLFLLAAAWLTLEVYIIRDATVETEAEVVRVYSWEGETIMDRGEMNYSPSFRYVWTDGKPTEATAGMSHPDWNLAVGSRHTIRYYPDAKRDIVFRDNAGFAIAGIIALIGLAVLPFSLIGTWLLLRWRRAGA